MNVSTTWLKMASAIGIFAGGMVLVPVLATNAGADHLTPCAGGPTYTTSCEYTVPADGTLQLTLDGAQGGAGVVYTGPPARLLGAGAQVGGYGAHLVTTVTVKAGQQFDIWVGQQGGDGLDSSAGGPGGVIDGGAGGSSSNLYTGGGGGGGSTSVFPITGYSQADVIAIAGGGGGTCFELGGNAGNADGSGNPGQGAANSSNGGGGGGATQSGPGQGGTAASGGSGSDGVSGGALFGGDGGNTTDASSGGGGGGGGGYFGGGGGGPDDDGYTGAGGGGSSYVNPADLAPGATVTYSTSSLANGQATVVFSPSSPTTTTLPTTTTTVATAALASTGTNATTLVVLGGLLLASGGIAIAVRRRASHS